MAFIATVWEGIYWIYLAQNKRQVLCSLEYVNETLGSTGWAELLNQLRNSGIIKDSDPRIYLFSQLCVSDTRAAMTEHLCSVAALWLLQIAMFLSIKVRYTAEMKSGLTRII
jgi:hypothetical protein